MKIETNKTWTVASMRAALANEDGATTLTFGKTLKADVKGECWCGCGGSTGGKFVPGHDSRFHSLAKQVARGQETRPTSFVCDEAEADFDKWHDAEVPMWEAKEAFRVAKETAKKAGKVGKVGKVEPAGKAETEAVVTSMTPLDKDSAEFRALLAEVTGN